jgi:hypothetical protein
MTEIEMTPDQIAQTYRAAMDSVNLINAGNIHNLSDAEWADNLARNKEHLRLILTKTFWTTEDLTPIIEAAK